MTLGARITRLESRMTDGTCTCADNVRVVWPDNYRDIWGVAPPPTGAAFCPACGGRRADIHIDYLEHWRMTDDTHGTARSA